MYDNIKRELKDKKVKKLKEQLERINEEKVSKRQKQLIRSIGKLTNRMGRELITARGGEADSLRDGINLLGVAASVALADAKTATALYATAKSLANVNRPEGEEL